jgi:5-methylcytosine-specific restriction endonuclease McrA
MYRNMDNVLVLNYDFTPLNVTSFKRGFILVNKGKAEIIKSDANPILTEVKKYVRPLIIRLLNYINFYKKILPPTRNRIYKRDNHECVYCGSKKQLTLDHVIPKSRGGSNNWENLVTSCFKCNSKKSNMTPDEAKMKLRYKPFVPNTNVDNQHLSQLWSEFKLSFGQ